MNTEFFRGVKQWEIFQADGKNVKLPCFYYDTTSLTVIYTASTQKVLGLLPLGEMHPVELLPGRCLIAFTAFEYRKTDIDPYNELSIAFPITYGTTQIPLLTSVWQMMRRCISAYVWQLPVTTEIARKGGVEMYGFPKFIAEITFDRQPGTIACDLSENGTPILTLKGSRLRVKCEKTTRFITYSEIDGTPLRANVFINPIEFAQTSAKNSASVELGTHRIADTLRTLELSRSPVMYQYSPLNQAILFAGRNLMDD